MSTDNPNVVIHTSPHIHQPPSVESIMRNVVYSLLPLCAWSIYVFGISALALIVFTTATCLLTETVFCKLADKTNTIGDFSAIITGILLALTLPPGFPLWMAVVAGFIAIAMGKILFGGLGYNILNPALVGRAFVQAAFPVAITTWTPAFAPNRFVEFIPSTWTFPFAIPAATAEWSQRVVDGFSGATPLALQKFEQTTTDTMQLLIGTSSGSIGETSSILILVCGAYLVFRRMMDWRIPAAILFSTYIFAGLFHLWDTTLYPDPVFHLLSGGLMLGAVFMATDMVASPTTPLGVWIYGAIIGFLTIIIRLFGGLPEGIMYAILLGNAASPLIAQMTQPRIYGALQKEDKK